MRRRCSCHPEAVCSDLDYPLPVQTVMLQLETAMRERRMDLFEEIFATGGK